MGRRPNARAWARQMALLVGSFSVTLALLMTVWMVGFGGRSPLAPEPTASPTPAPEVTEAPVAPTDAPTVSPSPSEVPPTEAPTPSPTPAPTPVAVTPTPAPSPTQAPLRTPFSSVPPQPTTSPADTITFVVHGSDYVASDVPSDATLARFGTSAVLTTTSASSDALWVTWRLDPALLPVGRTIHSVNVRICGEGTGHFWEVYGPDGGDPFEYEVVPPNDGDCWLFSNAPGHDLTVLGGVMLESRLTITSVEYEVTFGI
jgi:hypothetical protein